MRGLGDQPGGGPWTALDRLPEKGDRVSVLRRSSDGQRVGTGCGTERGGAGRRAPASLPRPSQVTDPAGPRPAPPHIPAARPGAPDSSQRRRAWSLRGPVRAWTRAPVLCDPAARHGRRGRPLRPPGAPPGARARPGADRKSRGRRHARAGVRGAGAAGPRRQLKDSAGLPARRTPPCLLPPRFVRPRGARPLGRCARGARPGAANGDGRAGEPEGPCREPLGAAWEPAAWPGAGAGSWQPREPRWPGRQWCPFTGLGSLRPASSPGAPAPARRRSAPPLPLRPAPTPAPASRCRGPPGVGVLVV